MRDKTAQTGKNSRGGRPTKINDTAKVQIYAILAVGASLEDAADFLGVDRSTITRSMQRDRLFAQGIKRAEARGKIRHLKKIGQAKAWQASAWMLERKWYKEFARRDPRGDAIDSDEFFERLAGSLRGESVALPPGAVPTTALGAPKQAPCKPLASPSEGA